MGLSLVLSICTKGGGTNGIPRGFCTFGIHPGAGEHHSFLVPVKEN